MAQKAVLCCSLIAMFLSFSAALPRITNPFAAVYKSDPNPLVLSKDAANNFGRSPSRRKRDLWEECYDEGCSKEEVEEVVEGHALYQYYYGWRCMKLYGWHYTYSYNPSRLQCVNSIRGLNTCASGRQGMGVRSCYFGSAKNVYAIYMENGCNNGQLASFKVTFNDPSNSVRYVYHVGCREKKSFAIVRGATSYTARLTWANGNWVTNSKLGWFGYNAKYCGNPGSPANGYFKGSNYYETSSVNYYCRYGFTRVGSSTRTCMYYGWSGSLPSCKRLCDPGTYSSRGYEPCSACPIGKYQPNKRSTSCITCPAGKSTSHTGRRFQSECHQKCSKAVCHLQQWSNWIDSSTPFQTSCASRYRTRSYLTTWTQVLNPNGCGSVLKTCPSDQTQQEQKEVYCDPIAKPEFGYYQPEGCMKTKQACKSMSSSTCVFHCDDGFQTIGKDSDIRRTCQPSGKWSFSEAKCKDIKPPKITCPSNVQVGNDPGKPYARVTLPMATAEDNSGKNPSIRITTANIEAIQDFRISANPVKVEYEAIDGAGLSDTCHFYVQVKDVEKPAVVSCPDDYSVFTSERPKNIMFKEPKFKDNFDSYPKISSSHTPGQAFNWDTFKIIYNATDSAGNMASCSYNLQVGPMKCPLYDPPDNGVRACNIKLSGVKQEYICTVECRDQFDFVDPPKWHSYNCKEDGKWYGYKMFNFEQLTIPSGGKPWPDCSVKSPPTGVTKKAKVYAGRCLSGDQETQNKIKQNFIDSLKADYFINSMICESSADVECQYDNVKVYCGKNSKRKRGLSNENVYVIEIDFELLDRSPSSTESEERQKIKSFADTIEKNVQKLKDTMKRAGANALHVQSSTVDVEHEQTITGACALGKVVRIKSGDGSDLDRSGCVDCSAGTYYEKSSKKCIKCPQGTYQDMKGKLACKTCPSGTDTATAGAKNIEHCKAHCPKGEYSVNGLATCTACPVGQYQPNSRSTSCLKCPAGMSTMGVRTSSVEDCKEHCSAGHFSKDGGLGACVPCPRGQYQPSTKATSCIPCSSGYTTVDEGATSPSQCESGRCVMDFENGKDHWTKTGTAFNNQPTYGDNPRYRNRESSQHEGDWWIGGYENRPSASMSKGQVQGDGPQGTLTSPSFLITGNELSFLLGGGCDINLVRVELLIEGKVVFKETGKCLETMTRKYWTVSQYKGKLAKVRLIDHSSGGWGHINFDDLRGDTCI